MEKHTLDFHKTTDYFIDNLQNTNKLSDSMISAVLFKEGDFYTFLPENSSTEGLYDFKFGGKMSCIRGEMSVFIHNFLKINEGFVCIFDDFNASTY
ncbi:MAG: hypothetical protein K2X69_13525 [Silvanigrellaceae bacterium]|nr:hypothetical protein [Silvanigrellaceae bacterium]